jgi:hypothetical protein
MKRSEPTRVILGVLAAAFALATLSAACATEEIHQDTLVARQGDPADGAAIRFYFERSDIAPGDTSAPVYRPVVDGRLLVVQGWDDVVLFPGNGFCCPVIPAGRHTVALRDASGATYIETPLLETRAGLVHHLVVFGDGTAPEFRFYVDDPATVPAGMAHVRLLNALASRQALEAQRCPDDPTAPCTPLGDVGVAYGDTFETDSPRDTLTQLTWRVPAAGGGQPVFGTMANPLPPQYSDCISNYLRAILRIDPGGGTSMFDSGLGSGTPLCPTAGP